MSDGIYAALTGAIAQAQNLDSLSHNLANAPTAGFKTVRPTFREVLLVNSGRTNATEQHVKVDDLRTDFSQGKIRETGNPLDVALQGEGFLVVETGAGERYTRAGALSLSEDGTLVGAGGHAVMGQGGRITVEPGDHVHIDGTGRVISGERELARLKTVTFDNANRLSREGASLWRAPAGLNAKPTEMAMQGGAIEESNVNIVEAMTEMIWVARAYEIFTRSIETHQQIDRRVATDMGA